MTIIDKVELDNSTMIKVLGLLLREWCSDPVQALEILHKVEDQIIRGAR